jgi:hypothetical protein
MGAKALSKQCLLLELINLKQNKQVSSEGVISILEDCLNLKVLTSEISDNKWLLSGTYPQLRKIELVGKEVREEQIISIFESCPNLEEISLVAFQKVQEEEFKGFTKQYKNIHKISLFSTKITYENIKALIEVCPNLKTLDIRGTWVNYQEYLELKKSYPLLEIMQKVY